MTTVKEQTKMKFIGVDILNVRYDVLGTEENHDSSVDIDCSPKVVYQKDNANRFSIVMDVKLHSEDSFIFALRAIGLFELNTEITPEIKASFIHTNAPAIVFPYIRAFVSTFTANVGKHMETVILPTQFFKGELEEYKDGDMTLE